MIKSFIYSAIILMALFGSVYATEVLDEEASISTHNQISDLINSLDFKLKNASEPIISTELPWHKKDDLKFQENETVFWNQHFRAEIGQISLVPLDYYEYDYNNETETADVGRIKEIHTTLLMRSGFYKHFSLILGFGYANFQRDTSVDESDDYKEFQGYSAFLGIEGAFSVGNFLTLLIGIEGKMCDGWRKSETPRDIVEIWRFITEIKVLFELFGSYNEPTLNIGFGAGYHYYEQKWTIDEQLYKITPNNSEGFDNGPSEFDVKGIAYFSLNKYFSIGFEWTFIGVMQGKLIVSFIFE